MTDKENMMNEEPARQETGCGKTAVTVVDVVLLGGGWCAVLRIWRLAGGDWSFLCQSSCDAWLVGSADGDGSYRRDSRQPLEYPVVGGYRVSLPALSNSP